MTVQAHMEHFNLLELLKGKWAFGSFEKLKEW